MIALPTGTRSRLQLRRIGLRRADDVVLDRLFGPCPWPHLGADRDLARPDLFLRDDARVLEPLLERRMRASRWLVVLRGVVLRVLHDVAELARDTDALRDVAAAYGRQLLDLCLELLEACGVRMTSFTTLLLEPRT